MSEDAIHLLAREHALASWAAVALLLATAWVTVARPRRRGLVLAVSASTAVALAISGALGLMLEGAYRARLRQPLFARAPKLGWLFERKEHLAFGAIALGFCGLSSLLGAALVVSRARRAAKEREALEALAEELARVGRLGWVVSALLGVASAVASALVARQAQL